MALKYAGKLSNGVKVAFVEYLGNQALNLSISTDEIKLYSKASERPADETRMLENIRKDNKNKRLAVVAEKINKKIKS